MGQHDRLRASSRRALSLLVVTGLLAGTLTILAPAATAAPRGISVTPAGGLVTTEAGGSATFTIVLDTQPTANVSIGLSSNDTTEGTVAPSSVTFTTANWSVAQTVTVTGVDDLLVDGDQAYAIVTAPATSTDHGYNQLDPRNVSVKNLDNDIAAPRGITVTPAGGLVTTEAGGSATFTIVLDTQPTANVSIGLSSNDTTEGTVAPSSVTFTTANWSVAQTVTVTGVDDLVVDGNQGYAIVTSAATSTDPAYDGLDVSDVFVINLDNDTKGVTVTPAGGLVTTEAGGSATFTIVLDTQPFANVSIGLSSNNLSEGTMTPSSVTFTPVNWFIAQTVTVTGVDDLLVDGNQGYAIVTAAATSIDPAYNGLTVSDVFVINLDNE